MAGAMGMGESFSENNTRRTLSVNKQVAFHLSSVRLANMTQVFIYGK